MLEPAVTITDFIIAAQAAFFAARVYRHRLWFLFFFSLALSALAGGVVHGYLPQENSVQNVVWTATLIGVALLTLSAWQIGAGLLASCRAAGIIRGASFAQFVIVTGALLYAPLFSVDAIKYLPAGLFLLFMLVHAYRKTGEKRMLVAAGGLALIFVGSAIQLSGLTLHPDFNHNALYHLFVIVGLPLLYPAARQAAQEASR